MSIIYIHEDTRSPSLSDTVKVNGTAFNLTGATVKLRMRLNDSATLKVDTAATIVVAADGTVQYDWGVSDLDTPGSYRAWWAITLSNGKLQDSDEFPIVILGHQSASALKIRDHVETGMPDAALQMLVDEATAEVEARWGNDLSKTIRFEAWGKTKITLPRPALTITSVTELNGQAIFLMTLSAAGNPDYMLSNNGWTLTRLTGGTYGWRYFSEFVDVVYVPKPEQALRNRMVIDLVKIELAYNALARETVGDYIAESHGKDHHTAYQSDREQILMAGARRRGFRFV